MSTRSLNGKHILPVTDKVSPKDLLGYLRAHNVLLLDVRPRADFDREHIQSGAIVCIEPSVLERKEYVSCGRSRCTSINFYKFGCQSACRINPT